MADDAKILGALIIGGIALGGIAYIVTKARAAPTPPTVKPPGGKPPPGAVKPAGSVAVTITRFQRRGALFSLPNDVTVSVSGTPSAGVPTPDMILIIEMQTPAGVWVPMASKQFPSVAIGSTQGLSQLFTYNDLINKLGQLSTSNTPVRAHMILNNVAGKAESFSTSTIFTVNPPAPPPPPPPTSVAPTGTVSITLSRGEQYRSSYRRWADS